MANEFERQARLLIKEAWRHKLQLSLAFLALSFLAIAAGVYWPKVYTTSTTVSVEDKSMIDPLLEGRAVRADVYMNAQQALKGRTLLRKVAKERGLIDAETSPERVRQEIEALKERIEVKRAGQRENLVEIIYSGRDPDSAHATARSLAEVFIGELQAAKSQESESAYKFIDAQVQKYKQKLKNLKQQMRKLEEKNPRAQPDSEQEVSDRVRELRAQIDDLERDIQATEIREKTLESQLSGEAEIAQLTTAMDKRRQRIAELEDQLAELRLRYHETYPDIQRIKQQLSELRSSVRQGNGDQAAGSGASDGSGQGATTSGGEPQAGGNTSTGEAQAGGNKRADSRLRQNPVYQELQAELYNVRSELKLKRTRKADLQAKLNRAVEREGEVREVQAKYEKLERDYNVTQDIYQDLLARRENAQVSVNLDNSQQASTKVTEPAFRPRTPSGPGVMHFAIGGLVLGAGLPLGLLFGLLMIDPRVRSAERLSEETGLPVLETIPHIADQRERRRAAWATFMTVVLILLTLAGGAAAIAAGFLGYL